MSFLKSCFLKNSQNCNGKNWIAQTCHSLKVSSWEGVSNLLLHQEVPHFIRDDILHWPMKYFTVWDTKPISNSGILLAISPTLCSRIKDSFQFLTRLSVTLSCPPPPPPPSLCQTIRKRKEEKKAKSFLQYTSRNTVIRVSTVISHLSSEYSLPPQITPCSTTPTHTRQPDYYWGWKQYCWYVRLK